MTIVLMANTAEEDKPPFNELDRMLGTRPMMSLDTDTLRELCERLPVSDTHPVWLLVTDEDLVEAGAGIASAVDRLLKRRNLQGCHMKTFVRQGNVRQRLASLGRNWLISISSAAWMRERSRTTTGLQISMPLLPSRLSYSTRRIMEKARDQDDNRKLWPRIPSAL